jgi:AraC-like DNA-binding protein
MSIIVDFDSVQKYNEYGNTETLHPLVSVINLANGSPSSYKQMNMGIYAVVFKDKYCGELGYGRKSYDYDEGTLLFFAPGQVVRLEDKEEFHQPKGLALAFHPDLLHSTTLGKKFHEYTFFNYSANEALHLSKSEQQDILDCYDKIEAELKRGIDRHSKTLIVSVLELLLNYCQRFYERQFITREIDNKGILEKFEELLIEYYKTDNPINFGVPTVAYCADKLHLSSNYFGDLIKKETGKAAHEHIQDKVILLAKERISDLNKSISEVAYELGFKHAPHFTRLFKQKVGLTPNEYRGLK